MFEGVLRLVKPNFNGTIWRKIPMEALYLIPFWFGVLDNSDGEKNTICYYLIIENNRG